ncbi:TIGR01777 family oxidoreductase [Lentisphaera profundi]|uniref:TIGR01777 family oxidoreductase n=1 Tax=Lentisphaera profundi TaxID=1658616 RepID=A0ABY7VRF2_9BACT|nr:TIGR01777 family oxidoreductase [Lentisphaera profundi]WDE96785.1 TIGR01777 family oxidoreductase [Lentisphaera profundi]
MDESIQKTLLDSRVNSTKTLVEAIAKCESKPKVFICSSGVNFYGAISNDLLTEESPLGKSYLAEVCEQWESASSPLTKLCTRRVLLRTGVVLDPSGGMLAKIWPIFKLGLGGTLGLGKRYFPWISLRDMTNLIIHCIEDASLDGPINACAPQLITNKEFTQAISSHLNRPALLPIPSPLFKLLPKEMADDLFLCDLKIVPEKLNKSSFIFREPNINQLLKAQNQ